MCGDKFLCQWLWYSLAKLCTKNYENPSIFVKVAAKKPVAPFFLGHRVHTKFFWLHLFLSLLVSGAWWDWHSTWLTDHCPSVLWHCWLGHTTHKTVSKMTCDVLSGTLNPAIPYHWSSVNMIDVARWLCCVLECHTLQRELRYSVLRYWRIKECMLRLPLSSSRWPARSVSYLSVH